MDNDKPWRTEQIFYDGRLQLHLCTHCDPEVEARSGWDIRAHRCLGSFGKATGRASTRLSRKVGAVVVRLNLLNLECPYLTYQLSVLLIELTWEDEGYCLRV